MLNKKVYIKLFWTVDNNFEFILGWLPQGPGCWTLIVFRLLQEAKFRWQMLSYSTPSSPKIKSFENKKNFFTSTAKPVYNDHPRDLKNVVVVERFVWKRSVVSEIQAGVDPSSWPLLTGGHCSEEVVVKTVLTVAKFVHFRICIK